MVLLSALIVFFVMECAVSIANKNKTDAFGEALLDLSNLAIQSRQSQRYYAQYYPEVENGPSYYNYYKPQRYQYGYSPDYSTNEISQSPYRYHLPSYSPYAEQPHRKPPFVEKTQQSVMDALFSIAQNDNLQCVPKLLCEVTAGGLTGRQGGLNLPVNINLESLTTFLSGLNSAQMSPVLHFGKAAILGFASKGNSRSCQYAYPECPSDPHQLIQYLNNHNGGFFRFFQGVNPHAQPSYYQQNYAHYYNRYRPGYFGKNVQAEERIQNKPADFNNNDIYAYNKEHRGLIFPVINQEEQRISFPSDIVYDNSYYYPTYPGSKTLKFPSVDPYYRRGKELKFHAYHDTDNDNNLDIQRPLPNHVPTPNIFPDRTGTGELKLDLDDVDNQQQALAYDYDEYNRLLYDSFPNDNRKPSKLSFPDK